MKQNKKNFTTCLNYRTIFNFVTKSFQYYWIYFACCTWPLKQM